MSKFVRNLIWLFVALVIIYSFTGYIVKGIQYILFKPDTYITFIAPLSHFTKYFVVSTILIALIRKHATLTEFGRVFTIVGLVISLSMIPITSLWFNAVNEEYITKFRVFTQSKSSWENVDHISTLVSRERRMSGRRTAAPSKTIIKEKYNIHFKNGEKINVWGGVEDTYKLHKFIKIKNIEEKHLTKRIDTFEQTYGSLYKGRVEEAKYIFGVSE